MPFQNERWDLALENEGNIYARPYDVTYTPSMTAGRKWHNLEALIGTLGAIIRTNQKRKSIGVLESWGQQFFLA
jgi:hypothetical protein